MLDAATVGLIGLGLLGETLVSRPLGSGFPVAGFDIEPRKVARRNLMLTKALDLTAKRKAPAKRPLGPEEMAREGAWADRGWRALGLILYEGTGESPV